MANENLKGLKVAILIEDGFEQVEMVEPRRALDQAGAVTHIVSPRNKQVRSWVFTDWGEEFPVDAPLDKARPDDTTRCCCRAELSIPTSSGCSRRRSSL